MNLDELRSIRDEERESGSIQPLRPSFYEEARTYIETLREERDERAEESDAPFSDSGVARLSDRLETAQGVLQAIYENRVGKILRHASTAALSDDADQPPLTREESIMYETLVEAIKRTEAAALHGEDEIQRVAEDEATDDEPEDRDESPQPSDTEIQDSSEGIERLTVRITEEVGTIFGLDEREYELHPGDIVSLPKENAQALIEREAAEGFES